MVGAGQGCEAKRAQSRLHPTQQRPKRPRLHPAPPEPGPGLLASACRSVTRLGWAVAWVLAAVSFERAPAFLGLPQTYLNPAVFVSYLSPRCSGLGQVGLGLGVGGA
eukprot:388565-Rhodomonas_salina.1